MVDELYDQVGFQIQVSVLVIVLIYSQKRRRIFLIFCIYYVFLVLRIDFVQMKLIVNVNDRSSGNNNQYLLFILNLVLGLGYIINRIYLIRILEGRVMILLQGEEFVLKYIVVYCLSNKNFQVKVFFFLVKLFGVRVRQDRSEMIDIVKFLFVGFVFINLINCNIIMFLKIMFV